LLLLLLLFLPPLLLSLAAFLPPFAFVFFGAGAESSFFVSEAAALAFLDEALSSFAPSS
tara:strand:+ start:144 stop:320 length:177 start_codon:yes stop_codon:yes gene_type:complete